MGRALEAGEGAPEGIGRLFAVNPGVFGAAEGETWGQHRFRFVGRTPAPQPDHAEALRAFRGFVEPFRNVLNPLLAGLCGKRDEGSCAYSSLSLYWTTILGFFLRLRSRNQMDMARNTRAYSQTVLELSGQPYDPDDPGLHTACSQTCRNHLAEVRTEDLESVLVELVRHLIRSKWFRDAMLWGCLCVAVDGTLRERRRGAGLAEKEKRRYALEARIITPWGWDIPLLTEAVDPYDDDRQKQDCEYRAFERLAARLKRLFPKQGFCIVGDALYCCRPVMDICRAYKWEFILTFKEGAMPKVHEAVQSAKRRCGGSAWLRRGDGRGMGGKVGVVAWADARECAYELGEGLDFRAVSYFCWDESEGRYRGDFATSFEVKDAARAETVASWGRRRWNIEEGFKVEKHGGFGLEHSFCNDETVARNYHVLMQIAYALWQVFNTGMLSRLSDGCRKPTQEMWANLLFVAVLVLGLASVPRVEAGAMRMRRWHLVA